MYDLILLLLIGLVGGTLGGFLGIGGSLIFIPAMALFLSRGDEQQHLFQASAMIINLFVSLSAVIRHMRAGVVRIDAFVRMMPAALVFIFVGVWASNHIDGTILQRVFAIFLGYVVLINLRKIVKQYRRQGWRGRSANSAAQKKADARRGTVTTPRSVFIGVIMGFVAGLLGIGGGGIAVSLQQVIFKNPLKQCIGTSSAVICITAGFGALYKNLTLPEHGFTFLNDAFPIVIALVPGAMIGAFVGATMTHKLPTLWVRAAFVMLLVVAGLKMSGLV